MRICGWKGKLLSRAGKEILLKLVAQAIPSYYMSVPLLLSSLCEKIQRS